MKKIQSLSNIENQLNNDVANDEFHGMDKVSPMEMILNNPGGFVQLAEKNRYVCFINNQNSKKNLNGENLFQ